ncbi:MULTISPECIES: hypothetical protein [unclassified Leeuwenhoekiella]|uniref:hypothetical protein n=1 Tax=unclassified Leeuwenhoekiella TaxID=2615029 RepID=UPI000C3D3885|nr:MULTISPECIES: hypothetical protein [unclassified Leeuwenhoekiella]MAW95267.1 hypothetical protein [Leeuwenhoekiella sp.]MBA81810.1 hypothetical protein [Leeuwenhoekiella sp.]
MKKLLLIFLVATVICSCDDDDNTISVGLLAEHRGIYINDFYTSGILGNATQEDNLLAWVDQNDFTDIYLYNVGAILGDGLDNELRVFVNKAHNQNPYLRVSFVSAGFGDSFTAIENYHDGRKDSKPDGIVSEIEFWNGSMNFTDDYVPWIDKVNDLKFTPPPGEVAPLNAGITRQFYIGKIKDPGSPPSLIIAKELVQHHDEIFLTNYHTDAWQLSGSTAENSIVNKLNLLAQAGMELNKEVNIVILFNVFQLSPSPEIWDYFATGGMNNEFEDAFVEWSSDYNASTAITNKEFLNIKGFGIYRYSDGLSARPL